MKKLIIFNFLVCSIIHAIGQDKVVYADSPPFFLRIGSSETEALQISSLSLGEKLHGDSEPVKISFGFRYTKKSQSESNTLNLKIGEAEPTLSRTTVKESVETTSDEISTVPNYYALFIGIDQYRHATANLSNLDKPIRDAATLKEILVSKYSFPERNSTLLKNPTRAELIKALEDLAHKITPSDNLLIFYAGHGYWDERLKVGYWLPSDSKIDDKSSWIANSTIRDYIAGIQSKHTLLISDACFSGSIFKTREVISEVSAYGVSKIYQMPSRKAMTSGTLTTVPDDSKFMQYLVKRLSENSNKYLTTRQLFYSLETAVLNNTNTVPQLGVIQDTGDEGGDFIFINRQ